MRRKVLTISAVSGFIFVPLCLGAQIILRPATPPPIPAFENEKGDADLLAQLRPILNGIEITSGFNKAVYPVTETIKLGVVLPLGKSTVAWVTEQPVNLDILLKGFVFADTVLANKDSRTALPVFDLRFLGGSPTNLAQLRLDSVPGYVGKISGTLPVSSEVVPGILATWYVIDHHGHEVSSARLSTPDGLTGINFSVQILPPLTELVAGLKPAHYTVRASVRLKMGGTFCAEVAATCTASRVVDYPVAVEQIGIPTIAAFFSKKSFEGSSLLVFPNSSPIPKKLSSLLEVLVSVHGTIDQLKAVPKFEPLLPNLEGFDKVIDVLQHTDVVFKKANSIDHFTEIAMRKREYGPITDDTDADDFFESLFFVGTTRRLECYSEPNMRSNRARFTVAVPGDFSDITVLVASLDAKNPSSDPAGRVNVLHDDPGSEHFANSLSSMKFYFP